MKWFDYRMVCICILFCFWNLCWEMSPLIQQPRTALLQSKHRRRCAFIWPKRQDWSMRRSNTKKNMGDTKIWHPQYEYLGIFTSARLSRRIIHHFFELAVWENLSSNHDRSLGLPWHRNGNFSLKQQTPPILPWTVFPPECSSQNW